MLAAESGEAAAGPTGDAERRVPEASAVINPRAMRIAIRAWLAGRLLALPIGAAALIGCAAMAPPAPAPEAPLSHTVRVISNGWHTGIVVRRAGLPRGRVPEAVGFAGARFLEFGWGDRAYYPSPRPGLGTTLAAALVPTPAVMHLAGLEAPPEDLYPQSEVLALRLGAAVFERLMAEIDASFERPDGVRAEAVAPGLYRDSRFYPARGRFHLFNTCNTWIARMLAAAGVEISPSGVVTAEHLMSRLRDRAGVTRRGPAPG